MKQMQRISRVLVAVIGACALLGTQAMAQSASGPAFRNTVKPPPSGWTGPVFKLSRDYPSTMSGNCVECTWLKVDVDFNPKFPPPADNQWASGKWDEYLKRVLAYVKQGQDPQLGNTPGFQIEVSGKARWFNVPWMADRGPRIRAWHDQRAHRASS